MPAIVVVVAPMFRRARKKVRADIGSASDKAGNARNSKNATENVVALFTTQIRPIDIALVHVQAVMDKRCRIVDIVALLDGRNKSLGKSRCRSPVRQEPPLEKASHHEIAFLIFGLDVAGALHINVAVSRKMENALALEHKRTVHLDCLDDNRVTVFVCTQFCTFL